MPAYSGQIVDRHASAPYIMLSSDIMWNSTNSTSHTGCHTSENSEFSLGFGCGVAVALVFCVTLYACCLRPTPSIVGAPTSINLNPIDEQATYRVNKYSGTTAEDPASASLRRQLAYSEHVGSKQAPVPGSVEWHRCNNVAPVVDSSYLKQISTGSLGWRKQPS